MREKILTALVRMAASTAAASEAAPYAATTTAELPTTQQQPRHTQVYTLLGII